MISQQFRAHFPFFADFPTTSYLDSAATTLKPQILLDATARFYRSAGSVHRSQYDLAQTQAYEHARDLVAKRFNVAAREAVIWTSGTTHAINLVAYGIASQIQAGDEILISVAEHHANFIPWQQLAARRQAKLIVLDLDDNQQIQPAQLLAHLSPRTKMVAFNLVSNVSGTRQAAETLIPLIRAHSNAQILLDIAQAVCTEAVDVQKLDADFYCFSAHKMYGPTGVGVLTGKLSALEALAPLFFGGKMLQNITQQQLTLADLPYRLEAGTPNIAAIIGFGEVLAWLEQWDFTALNRALYQLAESAYSRVKTYPNVQIIGDHTPRTTLSFTVPPHHYRDIADILAEQQVAIRSGEHCAKPYLRYLAQHGTLRISLAHYNQAEDLTRFFEAFDLALTLLA